MTLVKSDVMQLAKAFRIEVTGAEPIRQVYARIAEKARDLTQPVQLYGPKHPIVTEWARLALAEAERYGAERAAADAAEDAAAGHAPLRITIEPDWRASRGYLFTLIESAAGRERPPLQLPPRTDEEVPAQQRAEEWAATQGRRQGTGISQ